PDIGNAGANTSLTVSGLPFGEYYASVQAIDHSFAGSYFSDSIFIVFLPTATFSIVDTACTEELVVIFYTGNAPASAQYIWDFDGATVVGPAGQGPVTIYWDDDGLKTVTLTVIENGMTSIPVSHDVEVIEPVSSSGTITGETEFCQGTDSTEYIVSPIPGAVSYGWELDPQEAGTVTGSSLIATVAWDASFSGAAHLSVSGENYCGSGPASDDLLITVNPKPGKPGTPEGPSELCQDNENTIYMSSGAQYGLSYEWALYPETAGNITGNGLEAEVDWDDAYIGSAEIIIISGNTCGNGPPSDTLDIIIQIPPDADAGDDQVIDYQTSTQLQGIAGGGSGSYLYYWMPDELLVDPTAADPQTLPLEFSVQFTLTVTDELSGCTAEDQMIITVIGGVLSVEVSAEPEEVCEGEPTQLLALPSGGSGSYTFAWSSDPSGFTSDISNPIANPLLSSAYYVNVNDGFEDAVDSVEVVVLPFPDSPGVIMGPSSVCAGDDNVLYEIDPVPNATDYMWSLTDGIYGNSDSSSILLSYADPFISNGDTIKVWSVNDCGISTEFSFIIPQVKMAPEKPLDISGPDSLCTTTDTVVIYILQEAVALANDYEWMVLPEEAGYFTNDGLTATMHWVQNWEGDAAIIVRALNECGESGWSDHYAVTTFSCVGIFEDVAKGSELVLFPNPADEVLNLEFRFFGDHRILNLSVYDIYGRMMETIELTGNRNRDRINTANFPQGLYILRLYDENEVLATSKFIISR
ncbi:MAG: T9SS type A sorting domain-containing protein, partial [Bacteroidota bacterium]